MGVSLARLGLVSFFLSFGVTVLVSTFEDGDHQMPGSEKDWPAVQGERAQALGPAVDSIPTAR
jgi:hypothetical protein